jgi:beta-glucosidase
MRTHVVVYLNALVLLLATGRALAEDAPAFRNPDLPTAQRVEDLLGRMTLEEKVSQMQHQAPAIERLGVPAYNWWNEALHGVARNGVATVFPQAIGLAAAWDTPMHKEIASVISDEARAKYHEALRKGEHGGYQGLTFWSPNINIFRDPRWGRGQETYGEDPFLTARLGVAFVEGMQGDDPRYLKTVSTPKHFAVHSGPEPLRHGFDAEVSEYDLWNTYLPAFKATVQEGHAESVMCAYNALDGEPCCGDPRLLTDILRNQWGFQGYVVSDCDAIADIQNGHHAAPDAAHAAAAAVKAGDDLNCGGTYGALVDAVKTGILSEEQINVSVRRLLTARFRLGMFDPPERVPYAQIPFSDNDSAQHDTLARRAARESIVLLKNSAGTLPLGKNLREIAVIGPNADNLDVLLGNYNGDPSHPVTVLQGVRNAVPNAHITYAKGCDWTKADASQDAALANVRSSDAVVMVMGISPRLEGEEMQVNAPGFSGGDRTRLDLPDVQKDLIRAVTALGKPTVLVLLNGSALAIPWADAHVPAIVEAWYPGQQGGNAVADVLFGDYNPAGRLPVTVYRSVDDLPPFTDYNMTGRTYRYFQGRALYPFGYGLSYTRFAYSGLKAPARSAAGKPVTVSVDVKNTGRMAGDEAVQLYIRRLRVPTEHAIKELKGFQRVSLKPGERRTVRFTLSPDALASYDTEAGAVEVAPGDYEIQVGASSQDIRVRRTLRVVEAGRLDPRAATGGRSPSGRTSKM